MQHFFIQTTNEQQKEQRIRPGRVFPLRRTVASALCSLASCGDCEYGALFAFAKRIIRLVLMSKQYHNPIGIVKRRRQSGARFVQKGKLPRCFLDILAE